MSKQLTPEREKKKKALFAKCKRLLKEDAKDKKRILIVSDLIALSGVSESTFYEFFHGKSEELEELKRMISETATLIKWGIREKLYKSRQSAGLIALYKLVGTKEERAILSDQVYNEEDGKVTIVQPILNINPLGNDTTDDGTQED